jgi:predicted NBD/HSP70 family sugar kinase
MTFLCIDIGGTNTILGVGNSEFKDSKQIFEEYQNYNSKAEKTIAKMHEVNGFCTANISNLFNPEKIILGGALPLNHPEIVVKPLRNEVKEESVNRGPEIELCDLEEKSVIQGLRAVCNGKYKPGQR